MIMSEHWAEQALCRQVDTGDMFFPSKGGSTRSAKTVCRACPVRDECLQHALDFGITDGVFGGMSPTEREALGIKRKARTVLCDYCLAPFETTSKRERVYCTRACGRKAVKRRNGGVCIQCGAPTSSTEHLRCGPCASRENASTLWHRSRQVEAA